MAEKQKNRICTITTPLGDDVLLVRSLRGTERMSDLFRFELDLVSADPLLDFDAIVGQPVTVAITLAEDRVRTINGVVARFSQLDLAGREAGGGEVAWEAVYKAEIVAWPWLLTRRTNCRIFQNLSVPDIVKAVFEEGGFADFDLRLKGEYHPRLNCVQYRETDFAFVSRLLEDEGIFYFFQHEEQRHLLVLADAADQAEPVPDMAKALFHSTARTGATEDRIEAWGAEKLLQPGRYALTDYNFHDPGTDLQVSAASKVKLSRSDGLEIFDFPGNYVGLGEEEEAKLAKGEERIKVRMEEGDAQALVARGRTTCRAFQPGYRFDLDGHPRTDYNVAWLLTEVVHELEQPVALGAETEGAVRYANRVSCIPHAVPFRPARRTPRPRVGGPQTALVVGPGGEEIYVDKHGRVKVQFHWDRYGQADENSSCWVRVSQNWAGKQWGILFHPRLGQEVVVEFLEGDPDRPLITGRVYNGVQPIPFEGPTQSGILTRSTKEGSAENFNQLRFEDKKGSEQIYVHAEKDLLRVVENNQTEQVGVDHAGEIGANKSVQVGKNQTESIGADMTLTVGANRSVSVGKNLSESVGASQDTSIGKDCAETVGADRSLTVGKNSSITVGKAESTTVGTDQSLSVAKNRSVDVGENLTLQVGKKSAVAVGDAYGLKAKKVTIEAQDELKIKVGSAELMMKKNGDITLKGGKINVKGSGDVVIKGTKVVQN